MESLSISIDKPEEFDAIVQNRSDVPVLAQASQIRIITKHGGTDTGKAIAMVTFEVEVDGKIVRAQAVTTMRLLRGTAQILLANYTVDGLPIE